MGAELARKRAGKKTRTGMSIKQLRDFARKPRRRKGLSAIGLILLILLFVLLLGALPLWPYSGGWGYEPGGVVGLILVIVIILVVAEKI